MTNWKKFPETKPDSFGYYWVYMKYFDLFGGVMPLGWIESFGPFEDEISHFMELDIPEPPSDRK